MIIGTFGYVIFETSADKIVTFDGLKRQGSARYATHDILGKKPVLEFLGAGAESISFSMRLDVALGINPTEELDVLRFMRDEGEAAPLILNDQPIGETLWVIDSLSEDWKVVSNMGHLLVAVVDVTLKEYAVEVAEE